MWGAGGRGWVSSGLGGGLGWRFGVADGDELGLVGGSEVGGGGAFLFVEEGGGEGALPFFKFTAIDLAKKAAEGIRGAIPVAGGTVPSDTALSVMFSTDICLKF